MDAILIASVSDAEPILPASAMTKLLPEVMSPVVVIVSIYASFQYFASEPKSTSLSVVGLNTPSSNKICEVPSISKTILLSVLKSIFA